nr:hypothetical protein [Acidovorax sp. 69]
MITTLFFLAALMVGVPIGVCLCLSGAVYILSIGSPVLFQSFPMQMFGGWTATASSPSPCSS